MLLRLAFATSMCCVLVTAALAAETATDVRGALTIPARMVSDLQFDAHTTPLMAAIDALSDPDGSVQLIEILIRGGADVSARDARGDTPLHHLTAFESPHPEDQIAVAKLLVAAGADVNAVNDRGEPVLDGLQNHASCGAYEGSSLDDYLTRVGARHSAAWFKANLGPPMYQPDWFGYYTQTGCDAMCSPKLK